MTTHPESVPFLLVRPHTASEDVMDDAETAEIPASKSVPPHMPPARVTTTETDLPSVIVDIGELRASEAVEAERSTDVDVLLDVSESALRVSGSPMKALETGRPMRPAAPAAGPRRRGVAIALVAALMATGGTFVGFRVFHVHAPGGAVHAMR